MTTATQRPTTDLALVADHIVHCRRRALRESTIYQRGRTLARLRAGLGSVPLAVATTEEIEATMDARGLASGSRACEVSHLRGFFDWVRWVGARPDDPALDLVRPKVPRRLPRPISDEALWRALDIADRPLRTILLLAAYGGLRAKEIAGVRTEHALLGLRPTPLLMIPDSKGGDFESIELHADLALELAEALPREGWAFPRRDGQPGPWRPWSVSARANHFLHVEVGVADTLHSLRHWYGTGVLRTAGGNLRVAQEALRHQSIASTTIYTFVSRVEVADAVTALPSHPARPGPPPSHPARPGPPADPLPAAA